MREKINELATEKFRYNVPELKLSKSPIVFDVASGESYEGTLEIAATDDSEVKGIVITDSSDIVFEKTGFSGKNNILSFSFHAKNFVAGDIVRGMIQILSDIGTAFVPFTANIILKSCMTSVGTIKDLYHFANFAKDHLDEAVKIFSDSSFEQSLLCEDKKTNMLYLELCKGKNKAAAMEEFLVAIHKKLPVKLFADRVKYDMVCHQVPVKESIVLSMDNFGYLRYEVFSKESFIVLDVTEITEKDFKDGKFVLTFSVNPEGLVASGKNEGKIIIRNKKQEIVISVNVECISGPKGKKTERYLQRKLFGNVIQSYLDYVCKRKTKEQYLLDLEQYYSLFFGMKEEDKEYDEIFYIKKLYYAYFQIEKNEWEVAKKTLKDLVLTEESLKKYQPAFFCFYKYLTAKVEEGLVESCKEEIKKCLDKNNKSAMVLWCLLEVDSELQKDDKRCYHLLYEQIEHGCKNPVIYQKLCDLYNNNPFLVEKITPETIRVLHWGVKESYLNKEVALKYAFLVGLTKHFHMQTWKDMCKLYKQYPEREILEVICSLLICGQKTSSEAFKWYTLGVNNNLKLTELYEYYMYSIDSGAVESLPKNVLFYFLYDNHLPADQKACLYASIIKNKESDPHSFEVYEDSMKNYLLEELEKGHINTGLAILYEEFLEDSTMNVQYAKYLPKIMFCYEIVCSNTRMKGVYVHHYGEREDEFSVLHHGKARIHLYSDKDQILLVDEEGNRYIKSIDYTMNKLLHLNHLALSCLNYHSTDKGLFLFLYDKLNRGEVSEKQSISIKQGLLKTEGLSEDFRRTIFSSLIRDYYEGFEGTLLDQTLKELDWDMVPVKDRSRFVEYLAIRHMYNKAMEGIVRFGYGKIDERRLLQISSPVFEKHMEEKEQMTKLAWHIFESGNFDGYMLSYLCHYYTGTVSQMVRIWKTAKAFQVDMGTLSSRIIQMALFTGEMSSDLYDVFIAYKQGEQDKLVTIAFLNWISYRYVVKNIMLSEKMFFDLMGCPAKGDVVALAILKYLSGREKLTKEETQFVSMWIKKFCGQRMVFPFYQKFAGKVALPESIVSETYVQYTANPNNEVCIHYTIESGNEIKTEKTEIMKNVYGGIHVKGFLLFQDETLTYSFTEYTKNGERRSEESNLKPKNAVNEKEKRYFKLNKMVSDKETGNELMALNEMKEYALQKEMVNSLFSMMPGTSKLITKLAGEESVEQNGREKYTGRT